MKTILMQLASYTALLAAGAAWSQPAVCIKVDAPGIPAERLERELTAPMSARLRHFVRMQSLQSQTGDGRALIELLFAQAPAERELGRIRTTVTAMRAELAPLSGTLSVQLCDATVR